MVKYSNYKYYLNFIKKKFDGSKKYYKKIFEKDKPVEIFLRVFESMNVFPKYPNTIIMPLKDKGSYSTKLEKNNNLKFLSKNMDKVTEELVDKTKEFASYGEMIKKNYNKDKIRRFFDYEIKDLLRDTLKNSKITVAWIKMYEILATYKMLDNVSDKTISTFHLCEHPGAFVFATKEYISNKFGKNTILFFNH